MTQNHDQDHEPEPRPFTRDEYSAELGNITDAAAALFWQLSAAVDRTPRMTAERATISRMFELSGVITSLARAERWPDPPAVWAEPEPAPVPEPTIDELRERLARGENYASDPA